MPFFIQRECGRGGEWSVQLFFRFLGQLYNNPGIRSAGIVFVQGIDRNRLDMLGLERSEGTFFQMVVEVCVFPHCAVEGGSQQVMLEGMLLPLIPVPPLNVDA